MRLPLNRLRRVSVAALALVAVFASAFATTPSQAAPTNKIAAFFVVPQATVSANEAMYRTMKADAISTGGRMTPSMGSVPAAVQSAMTGRKYYYDQPVAFSTSQAKRITVGTTTWAVVSIPSGSVAVKAGGAVDALVTAGNNLGAGTYVGLPRPILRTDLTYMPNMSYLGDLGAFTTAVAKHFRSRGAEGLYQGFEMPATNTAFWAPVRTLYGAQNRAVNAAWPGATVIISPYLESRRNKANFSPAQAGEGVRMIANTASGTRVIVAPQDGLGTGTTCLQGDDCRNYRAVVEDYWTAMNKALPTLWNNAETMRPDPKDPTKRIAATRSQISQSLWRAANRGGGFEGTISWSWNYTPGAANVPGVTDFSLGFGQTGK